MASAPVPVTTAVASVEPAPVTEEVAPVVQLSAREQRKRKNQGAAPDYKTPAPSIFPPFLTANC